MGPTNGAGNELQQALERIVAAFARINTALRTLLEKLQRLSEAQESSSERREKEFEILRGKSELLARQVDQVIGLVNETKGDTERIRDWTPIHGVPLHDPAKDKTKDTGGALAIRDGKVKFSLPASWAGTLLKLALSAGLGGLLMRGIQWLAQGK